MKPNKVPAKHRGLNANQERSHRIEITCPTCHGKAVIASDGGWTPCTPCDATGYRTGTAEHAAMVAKHGSVSK